VDQNVGMETSALLVDDIVNNALFHSNAHLNQVPPRIIHILRFYLVDSLSQILQSTACIEIRLFHGQKSGNSILAVYIIALSE